MSLRKQLIRLAHANPELRPDLLPLLRVGKLMKRQEKILKDKGGNAMSFDDLPPAVQAALRKVKDQETLEMDVDRWLGDNNNPHLRAAADVNTA